jgi:hypothetical protein
MEGYMSRMRYRLALDLGSTSLGWAMVRLKESEGEQRPVAVIKAGVRIFSDGRNPKDGSSLAVTRRMARAMRRRRDRLLKRKQRMMALLLKYGFFPTDAAERKTLELLNPYELRTKGLDAALTPTEFARALFHINQRRGFKSNRKVDKKENDAGALKAAIGALRSQIDPQGQDGKARTVGEWLWRRIKPEKEGDPVRAGLVRARYRENRILKDDGKSRVEKSYDLYIDRTMIEEEFDALWSRQSALNPAAFTEAAGKELKDCLLHQRPLRPVKPGRCTLEPNEERAPLALPSQQRFRIYQEVNNLRILSENLRDEPLTMEQRNTVVDALERNGMLRAKFGLNDILGLQGEKNRNDHRHHAVDACVIAITDQGMLQKFAQASASAREKQLDKLVETMPLPWDTYREHVKWAVNHIWVSHKPDHGYEGAMMEATAYGIRKDGSIKQKLKADGEESREIKNLIRISEQKQPERHGIDANGKPLPYIGYVGGSNYCIEIVRNENGKWAGEVISTFDAYQLARQHGPKRLRYPTLSVSGKPLVMRLQSSPPACIPALACTTATTITRCGWSMI